MSDDSDSGIFTLATQGSITFVGNVLGKALGFAFVVVATRLVTPSEYGIFTLGLSIVMFVQGFASLNIYRSVDYFVPQFLSNSNYGQAKKTLQNVFLIGIFASVLGAGVVFLAREQIATMFNEPRIATILTFFILLIPLQTVFRTLLASFNSLKKMKYRVIIRDLLNPLGRTIGAILLVSAGAGLFGLIGGYLLGLAIAVACGIGFLVYEADWIQTEESDSISNRSLLSYSLPLVLAGVIYSLVGQIDYFVIGYFLSSADVGYYRVSYLLAANLLIVLSAVTPVFKPMVAENQFNTPLLEIRYQLATRWVTMFTLPVAITLILAPDIYLSLLFTDEYVVASTALVALVVGFLLNAAFGPEGMILEGLGHTRLTLFNTLVLVTVNGGLDVFFIPRFGILGAGIATGSALTVAGLVGVVEIYLLRSITPLSPRLLKVWLAIVPSIVVGRLVVFFMSGDLLTAVLLPLFVASNYFLVLRVARGFSDDDREIASRIDDRLGFPLVQFFLMPNNR
ncbi:oligosaccharide flippase family protein [Halopenitus salinus]|uniref:Oligosaccharide flippase family protein n=1 Tax=Halopenitus salinus TaxID=1198295 RepID=A0ABD5UX62_9EURY